jgi:diguanylate cyclase (GGDEF)-like protein
MGEVENILSEFGRRLRSSCRPYDMVGRYGISEFLLFVPGAGTHNAEKVARRIISAVNKKAFYARGRRVNIFITIGISELDPKEIAKDNKVDDHLINDLILDSLIKRTEIAVKKASKQKGSSIEIYRN